MTTLIIPSPRIREKLPWDYDTSVVLSVDSIEQILRQRGSGLVTEFGVHKGQSLKRIANVLAPNKVYGFDSFRGLAEEWARFPVGYWALDDQEIKQIDWPHNAELVVGWFADTVPKFVADHPEPFGYCHINSGPYSAATAVLNNIEPQIIVGTILHFGEIRGQTGVDHEIRAFNEYLSRSETEWQIIGSATPTDAAFKRIT